LYGYCSHASIVRRKPDYSFIGNTKTRISNIVVAYIELMPYSFSFIYIFSKFSYKKNAHLQMSIRIGNGTVVNDYPIEFVHITFIYCTEWLFLQSVTVFGCWKLSDFLQLLNSHGHLTFYEYLTITLHGLIKLSLQHFIILVFRVFFWVSCYLFFKGKYITHVY
jgi:hypothetical protein